VPLCTNCVHFKLVNVRYMYMVATKVTQIACYMAQNRVVYLTRKNVGLIFNYFFSNVVQLVILTRVKKLFKSINMTHCLFIQMW